MRLLQLLYCICQSQWNVLHTQGLLKKRIVQVISARFSILPFLKARVQLQINTDLLFLSDLPSLSGAPALLGMRVEFLSFSQVNKLKMPSDKLLWFMIRSLKKLHCVNHPSSESYSPTKGSQQKGMCVSFSDREKKGKAVTKKTQQEVSKGIKCMEWITYKNWLD